MPAPQSRTFSFLLFREKKEKKKKNRKDGEKVPQFTSKAMVRL